MSDIVLNLNLGGSLDNTEKIIVSDHLIGHVPIADIVKLKKVDGNMEKVCKTGIDYLLSTNATIIPEMVISGGALNFTLKCIEDVPVEVIKRRGDEMIEHMLEVSFMKPLRELHQVVKERKGSLAVASLIPIPANFSTGKHHARFLAKTFQKCNSIIWKFNEENGVKTPNLLKELVYRNRKLDCGQNKVKLPLYKEDLIHLTSEGQKRIMKVCLEKLKDLGES